MPGNERSQNDCPNCRRLSEQLQQTTALLEEATERIQRLERRVEQLEREGTRQAAPFRRPQKKRKKSPRKPGRKDGHKASYRKQWPHLLTFLDYPEVDPTNNLAERRLRPAVIARKLSCGNKTRAGAETFSILASVAATCRQQSRSFTDFVANCVSLQRSPPQLLPAE